MKSIMIIGAGFGQLPAISKSKKMGLNVIAIDKNPNAIGMSIADFSYPIDILDIDNSIKVALKHKIDGVMTMQTDLPVPTVGAINDALGLTGIGFEVASRCSNKISTRMAFNNAGIPQPKFGIAKSCQELYELSNEIGFPCIIKSADSSGSRGVSKVCTVSDIVDAFNEALKYSRLNEVLIEEYVTGTEIGAQTFSVNGRCESVFIHNDIVNPAPYMVPIGHSFPFEMPESKIIDIKDTIAKAVNSLGITDGPANVDLILDANSNPKLIEIGARIGATCLPELVEYHSGIDWVEQAILNAINESVKLSPRKNQPVTAFIIQAPKDGILLSYSIPEHILNHPNVLEFEITVKEGDEISLLRKGTDRIGKIIVTASSVLEANRIAIDLLKQINFEIK